MMATNHEQECRRPPRRGSPSQDHVTPSATIALRAEREAVAGPVDGGWIFVVEIRRPEQNSAARRSRSATRGADRRNPSLLAEETMPAPSMNPANAPQIGMITRIAKYPGTRTTPRRRSPTVRPPRPASRPRDPVLSSPAHPRHPAAIPSHIGNCGEEQRRSTRMPDVTAGTDEFRWVSVSNCANLTIVAVCWRPDAVEEDARVHSTRSLVPRPPEARRRALDRRPHRRVRSVGRRRQCVPGRVQPAERRVQDGFRRSR